MKCKSKKDGEILIMEIEGRVDTITAPQLEQEVKKEMDGVKELIFDFKQVEYISSAGLRVMLSAQKIMNKQGSMRITNTMESVKEVFDVTGLSDVMEIE